jgi:hypothetical protein
VYFASYPATAAAFFRAAMGVPISLKCSLSAGNGAAYGRALDNPSGSFDADGKVDAALNAQLGAAGWPEALTTKGDARR